MSIRHVPSRTESRWNLREIVAIAALGVVFGVVYWGLVAAWGGVRVLMGPFGDLAQSLLIGGWMVVAPLAIYIIRKPLTGVVAEIIGAFVQVAFLGSPVGPLLLLTGLVQGVGAELPFAATGYRRYSWLIFALSGLSAAAFSFVYSTIRFGWLPGTAAANSPAEALNTTFGDAMWVVFFVRLALHLTSGLVLCGLLARLLGDALKRTGVLDNFAIGQPATLQPGSAGLWGLRPFGLFMGGAGIVIFIWASLTLGGLGAPFGEVAAAQRTIQLAAQISLLMTALGVVLGVLGVVGSGRGRTPLAG